MAKDVADIVGTAIGRVARETVQTVSSNARKRSGGLKGAKGVAAGVGLGALAPVAAKGAGKLVKGLSSNGAGALGKAGEKIGSGVGDKVGGGVKDAVSDKLPGGGGGSGGVPGVGKGRRMPIQQDIDIGAPIKTVYNQFTQFEEWPKFMHRVQQVSQDDPSHVSFKAKIWGISKEFKAEIEEQRPDERIKWKVTEGLTHHGVVTFHELGPRLTRVELNLDVEPGSLIEKAARGMRHVKRAVRADLARFKAYVLMEEEETGSWRGEIEDGDVKRRRSSASSRRRSSSSSSGRSRSSSSGRSRSSSSGRSGSSSSGRSGSSSSGRSGSSSSGRSGSSSSGRSRSTSARSRSSSNGSRASSNGSSRSKSSGTRASSSKRKSGSRS